MASNQTAYFGLNQWSAGDQVVREEFNADNAKIDAALGAMPYIKILETKTKAAAKQINIDVSSVDFTRYYNVELYIDSATSGNTVLLQVNGLSSGYSYGLASGGGSSIGTTQYLGHIGGRCFFYTPVAGEKIGCVFFSGSGGGFSGYQHVAPCTWSELTTLNLSRYTDIPAGTTIVLFGIKK